MIFESVHGSAHTTVATVLTNLGSTWRKLGNSTKSKELFEKALKIEQELLEPLHPMVGQIGQTIINGFCTQANGFCTQATAINGLCVQCFCCCR